MVKVVSTDDIQEGMVLAEKLCNKYGQILLLKGINLTERHARVLKQWNIASVVIESEDEEIEISEEMIEKAQDILNYQMVWEPTHVQEEKLFEVVTMFVAKKLAKEEL